MRLLSICESTMTLLRGEFWLPDFTIAYLHVWPAVPIPDDHIYRWTARYLSDPPYIFTDPTEPHISSRPAKHRI
jgi:hypothetical protein